MRKNMWYRAGPGVVAALGALAVGCGGGGGMDGGADMAMMPGGDMAMMQTGDGPPPGGDMAVPPGAKFTAEGATQGGAMFKRPLDAVPSPDASTFYFLATNKDGLPGVFKVPAAGGMVVEISTMDAGLVAPIALAISGDGTQLFIGDPAWNDPNAMMNADGRGAIFVLAPGGGKPAVLMGVAGYRPRGLDVVKVGGTEKLYFTGVDPGDKKAGLFSAGLDGSAVTAVSKGGLLDPSGVAVADSGDAYLVDVLGSGSMSRVVKIAGGQLSEVVGGLDVGFPAGAALTMDAKQLFVSGNDPVTGASIVFQIDTATKMVSTQSNGLGKSLDSGGLHRARGKDLFSWCGVTVGGGGTVFRVEFK